MPMYNSQRRKPTNPYLKNQKNTPKASLKIILFLAATTVYTAFLYHRGALVAYDWCQRNPCALYSLWLWALCRDPLDLFTSHSIISNSIFSNFLLTYNIFSFEICWQVVLADTLQKDQEKTRWWLLPQRKGSPSQLGTLLRSTIT